MKDITIFTPTYNRSYILHKAYESLKKQKEKNFVWMIIDDGSTDNTEIIVNEWINEKKVDIIYYKIKNGGKANAFNYAIEKTSTEYFLFALDSDDIIVDNGIEIINKILEKDNHYNIYSFINKVSNTENSIKCDYSKLEGKSFVEALNEGLIKIETVNLFKTEYLKKFKFPQIDNEKFFTEAYIYYQMDCPVKWNEIVLEEANYLDDGLTKNTTKLFVKYPTSWYMYNKLRLNKTKSYNKILKYTIYLISFGLLSNNRKNIMKDSKYKFLTILLFPLGVLGKLYLKKKAR